MSAPDHQPSPALLAELRGSAPPAPERLRARIEELASTQAAPAPSWRDRLSLRRALLVAMPAAAAALLAVALVNGVDSALEPAPEAASVEDTSSSRLEAFDSAGSKAPTTAEAGAARARRAPAPSLGGGLVSPDPAKGRAQDYRVSLTVRVRDVDTLSARTQRAIRLTRNWGGFVVSADFDAPGSEGSSQLVLRVPIGRVQDAVAKLSALGTLAAQDVSIRDVQATLDQRTRRLLELREQVADLRAELADPELAPANRARLEAQLARAERQIAETRAARDALARRTSFATISLTLTTEEAEAAVPARPGRIERAARDAGSVLAKEVAWVLYVAIVAAPFLLLAAAGAVALRVTRRRADERLLEHA